MILRGQRLGQMSQHQSVNLRVLLVVGRLVVRFALRVQFSKLKDVDTEHSSRFEHQSPMLPEYAEQFRLAHNTKPVHENAPLRAG